MKTKIDHKLNFDINEIPEERRVSVQSELLEITEDITAMILDEFELTLNYNKDASLKRKLSYTLECYSDWTENISRLFRGSTYKVIDHIPGEIFLTNYDLEDLSESIFLSSSIENFIKALTPNQLEALKLICLDEYGIETLKEKLQ